MKLALFATTVLVLAASAGAIAAPPPTTMEMASASANGCSSVSATASWSRVRMETVQFDYLMNDRTRRYTHARTVTPRPTRAGSLSDSLANDGGFVNGEGWVIATFYNAKGSIAGTAVAAFTLSGC